MRIRSLHAPVADVVAAGAVARVVGVFRRAVNLSVDDDVMVALVAPELGNGPGTLVVEGEWPLPYRPGDLVRLDPAWAKGAVRWVLPEPPRAQNPALLAAVEAVARAAMTQDGLLPVTLGELGWGSAPTTPLAALAVPGLRLLLAGHWGAAVPALAGLGPGLTPAGDDLLAGCCVALHRAGLAEAAAELGAGLGRLDPGATTPLSRHQLRWAASGVAGEHHLAWLDSVLAGAPASPARLLSHGATSGADWAAGALCALEIVRRIHINEPVGHAKLNQR